MENRALQPSQYFGRSWVSRPYRRKATSRHSCAPSSVPFTVDGCTISQAPVFVARHNRRVTTSGSPAMVVSSDAIAFATLFRWTAAHPSQRQAAWSAVQNGTWPLSADTRCPVMTQNDCHLSGAVCVGSGMASPACFTGSLVFENPVQGSGVDI